MEQTPQSVIVRHGSSLLTLHIGPDFCVVDLLFDERATGVLGFSPFNARVIRNGLVLNYLDPLEAGQSLIIETAANTKGALPGPRVHKCERYRRKQGFGIAFAKGDHVKWIVGDKQVSVNYCEGELDQNSLKDLARHLGIKPRDLITDILTA